jgi:hypothetical protein
MMQLRFQHGGRQMGKTATSEAERMRRHREAFTYALAHGITPKEAEKRLAEQRWRATMARLDADRTAVRNHEPRPAPVHAPWMMRD